MALRISFTEHAVERYIERHARDLPHEEARRRLEEAAPKAVKLKEKTFDGDAKWRIDELNIEIVTLFEDGTHVCLTVLPNYGPKGMTPEELEIIQEHLEDMERQQREAAERAATARAESARLKVENAGRKAKEPAAAITAAEAEKVKYAHIAHLLAMECAMIREQAKTVRTSLHQTTQVSELRTALRSAIRFIHEFQGQHPEEASRTLAKIKAANPGFLNPDFYALEGVKEIKDCA